MVISLTGFIVVLALPLAILTSQLPEIWREPVGGHTIGSGWSEPSTSAIPRVRDALETSEATRSAIARRLGGGACTDWSNGTRADRWRCCDYQRLAAWNGIVNRSCGYGRYVAAFRHRSPGGLGCSAERVCPVRRPRCRASPARRSNRRSSDDTSGVDATAAEFPARTRTGAYRATERN